MNKANALEPLAFGFIHAVPNGNECRKYYG
jgi:hypothetical protein